MSALILNIDPITFAVDDPPGTVKSFTLILTNVVQPGAENTVATVSAEFNGEVSTASFNVLQQVAKVIPTVEIPSPAGYTITVSEGLEQPANRWHFLVTVTKL